MTIPAQNEDYRNYIVKYNRNISGEVSYVSDISFQIINDLYAVLYVPAQQQPDIVLNSYSYRSIPKCYTYMDLESLNASGVTRLQNHPYLQLRGRGTAVAVIDSGIDYQNPVFRDTNGSRILALWDQTAEEETPDGVPFGRVYKKEEIDQALLAENPLDFVPAVDKNGHGTMLAAAAAGNTVPEEAFSGVAPEAALIIVKLKPAKRYLKNFYLLAEETEVFQEDDIMLAISFVMEYARKFQMPLSICIGLGTNQGGHMGVSPLSQVIDWSAGFSQNAVSVAGGNEGLARHHYQGILDEKWSEQTAEIRVGEKELGFCAELWGEALGRYQISLESPTGETLSVSNSLRAERQELSFVFVETKIYVNYIQIERQSGKTLVFFRFVHPAAGIWKIYVRGTETAESMFHIWLPVQGMISPETFFVEASPYVTITSPGDTKSAITMTAYQTKDGGLYLQASRGYTFGEERKPNLAAPGVGIKVALPSGGFGNASGSSLAAAQAAGVAALMFEWALIRGNEPYFTGNSVKFYLERGAEREADQKYPNRDWGYGKMNLYRTFELLS